MCIISELLGFVKHIVILEIKTVIFGRLIATLKRREVNRPVDAKQIMSRKIYDRTGTSNLNNGSDIVQHRRLRIHNPHQITLFKVDSCTVLRHVVSPMFHQDTLLYIAP
jgi:hypothetical protein